MNWQKERFSQKQLTSESFDNDNKLSLKSFFAFCSVFFTRTNGGKMERTSRQTQCPVSKILQRYCALSFDRINFFTDMANLFLLCSRKAFVMCYCFRAFFFWRLANDCQIVRPALVSGPPNRKKPYNKNLISLVFSVRTVNYGSSFFFIASRLGHKSQWKKLGP